MSRICVSYDTDHPISWKLEQPYERQTSVGPILVPQGFVTDLASTPRNIWLRYPRWGKWSGAAIVHDYMYRMRPYEIERLAADRIFRDLMRADGVRRGDCEVLYCAVREFGGTAWRRWRKAEK